MANPNDSTCICGHAEDDHFKYGVPLNVGHCKRDGEDGHYCLHFESKTAEAERERLYQERCDRARRLFQALSIDVIHSAIGIDNDELHIDFENHRYQISEVEDNG